MLSIAFYNLFYMPYTQVQIRTLPIYKIKSFYLIKYIVNKMLTLLLSVLV